jgi:hypothetical protein
VLTVPRCVNQEKRRNRQRSIRTPVCSGTGQKGGVRESWFNVSPVLPRRLRDRWCGWYWLLFKWRRQVCVFNPTLCVFGPRGRVRGAAAAAVDAGGAGPGAQARPSQHKGIHIAAGQVLTQLAFFSSRCARRHCWCARCSGRRGPTASATPPRSGSSRSPPPSPRRSRRTPPPRYVSSCASAASAACRCVLAPPLSSSILTLSLPSLPLSLSTSLYPVGTAGAREARRGLGQRSASP